MGNPEISSSRRRLCIGLIVVSFILYFLIPVVALTSYGVSDKAMLAAALYVLSQATWISALALGRDYIKQHMPGWIAKRI